MISNIEVIMNIVAILLNTPLNIVYAYKIYANRADVALCVRVILEGD